MARRGLPQWYCPVCKRAVVFHYENDKKLCTGKTCGWVSCRGCQISIRVKDGAVIRWSTDRDLEMLDKHSIYFGDEAD